MNSPSTDSNHFCPKCLKTEIKSVSNSADINETDDRRLTIEMEIDISISILVGHMVTWWSLMVTWSVTHNYFIFIAIAIAAFRLLGRKG